MLEKVLRFFEKYFIPRPLYRLGQPIYHYVLSFFGALIYGFPSKKMFVIGVTGTKGKTTTCNLIARIFNSAGLKTGMITTVNLIIGDKEWKNETKQTMLGRFRLQKTLAEMAKENCRYAVVETSSEGIIQFRHRFIDYDMAVFTNLSPEHTERHGGFENYRDAKIKLFEKIAAKEKGENGFGVYNLDDENVEYFLKPEIKNKYGYGVKLPDSARPVKQADSRFRHKFKISNIKLSPDKTEFKFNGEKFETSLVGEFNVYNAGAAICAALSQNIPTEKIKNALAKAKAPAGRFEIIDKGQNFIVIIDYAHEPASLEAAYKTVFDSKIKSGNTKLICLLGAQGGGRDKWKRPAMGKIAGQYCDKIILTNEDPYDENPDQILSEIKSGISNFHPPVGGPISKIYEIIDRKEAVKKALSLAKKGDVVILTGKGGESWMCVEGGKKISWDEKYEVEKELRDD
ncbi:UDP-N-acetylmuramyl-tripeptide synthetase [Candidatus Wolfebacteria bacterium]|nr:UDP-N-acetylmuramyl-tripeptide synthetase [Candidatus Wolfebacteria bacterium]